MRAVVPKRNPDSGKRAGKKSRAPRSLRRRFLLGLAAIAVLVIVTTWVPVVALRWFDPQLTSFMLFNNPVELKQTRHTWRDRSDLGDAAALAVMAAEDQNFPNHYGLDLGAIADAVEEKQSGGRSRGASTITQQLAKNLFLWPGRSLFRKGLEAYLAVLIDAVVPKKRILEIYLNSVELGPGVYGYPAASLQYFAKEPQALTLSQAALLAAVLPNPIRLKAGQPSEYVRERQAWIADQAGQLQRAGWLLEIGW